MILILSIIVLIVIFYLYKYTYFFQKKQQKLIQYLFILTLPVLALINFSIGTDTYQISGFSWFVGGSYVLALLITLSWGKVLEIFIKASSQR